MTQQQKEMFSGDLAFLSNFAISPFSWWGHKAWLTVEHAYQAAKSLDPEIRDKIRQLETPGKAKRMGQKIEMRSDWENIKKDVMFMLLRQKFLQNSVLRDKLLATGGTHLVETNFWHDNFWGDCLCDKCKDIHGENWLGKLLMRLRREMRIK